MIKSLKQLKRRDWFMVLVSLVFIIFQVRLDLIVPDYMSQITRLVQTEGSKISQIIATGAWMLLASLGSVLLAVAVGYLAARIGASLGKNLRFSLFEKVQDFSLEEINRFSTASLITRSTNDVTQIQVFIAVGLQVIIKAPILAFSAVRKIASQSWQWSALVGGVVLFLLIIIIVVILVAMPKFKKVQELTDSLNLITRENLTGLKVVRAYNAEDYQQNKFQRSSKKLADNNLFATRVIALLPASMQASMSFISLGVYWLGAVIIDTAAITDRLGLFGDMVVFSSYAVLVVSAFMMMSILFILLPRVSVSAKRINEVLDTKPCIVGGSFVGDDTSPHGKIEFRDVSFTYPNAEEYVLKDINFTANPGETVAFIGSTGSGKSTLINLVPRFYDTTEGEVLIDGVNVKDYALESLYDKIGYVSQKAVIFSGSVKSNIAFGRRSKGPITDEIVRTSLDIAQGLDFVESMPDNIDSAVAQEGTNLSGGQKQRVAIARAVARNPEILIFDDSFSALDYKTDRLVRQELGRRTQGTTSLIVAQRIGTIKDADQIIVLDEGLVVGIGKHEELLHDCQIYREIAESQMSEEELYGEQK